MIVKELKHTLISHNPPIGQIIHVMEGTNEDLKNIGRAQRLIKLIQFLQSFKTYKEICTHLNISYKTSQRYIHLLLSLGFIVERKHTIEHRFRIQNTKELFGIE